MCLASFARSSEDAGQPTGAITPKPSGPYPPPAHLREWVPAAEQSLGTVSPVNERCESGRLRSAQLLTDSSRELWWSSTFPNGQVEQSFTEGLTCFDGIVNNNIHLVTWRQIPSLWRYQYRLKPMMTLTELIARLEDVEAPDGELPMLYPLNGQDLGRYLKRFGGAD